MHLLSRLLISLSIVALLPLAAIAEDEAPATPLAFDEAKVPDVMARAVDQVIRPGYRRFHASAGKLTHAMQALCASASDPSLAAAKTAFADTVTAWSAIEIVRVGPVIEGNRFERILFYPDRKSTGLKQVQGVLAKPDEKDTTAAAVATKSVAIQGLGALEFILYGTDADVLTGDTAGFRCRYGAAVAGNIENVAADLVSVWDEPNGIQAAWKHPGPDNPEFRTGREAITALLGILVHGVETVRDQRLETFYKGAQPRPRTAIYWRSQNTWTSIAANLRGLETLFVASDMTSLLGAEHAGVIGQIDAVMTSLIDKAPTIDANIENAVGNDAERAKIDFMMQNTRSLILKLNDDFGGALGLTAGFSFSDGD